MAPGSHQLSPATTIGRMHIRRAAQTDAAAIAGTYNEAIEERSATFETDPRSVEEIAALLGAKLDRQPVLVAELDGEVAGFAWVSSYRPRAAYDGVGEHSVYVTASHRGRGLGKALIESLIVECRDQGYWKLVSRIFPENEASLALHRDTGFREVGVYERHARLDGEWTDTVIVERLIDG